VWAIVSGVPSPERERQQLLMLQAFIDDSKGQEPRGIFLLGGYVATVECWAAFSDEWARVRDAHPKIRYFKLREAQRRIGQFYGVSEEICREKIAMFRGVIEQFAISEVCIAFRAKSHKEAFGRYGKRFENPYYFALAHLSAFIADNLEKLGLERDEVQFIFDIQAQEMHKVVEGWEWAVSQKHRFPDSRPSLDTIWRTPPMFQDDERVLPLQAADMHATHMRQSFEALLAKNEPPKLPGFTKGLPGGNLQFSKQQMTELADQWPSLFPGLRDD
jgi:hypothetical protein